MTPVSGTVGSRNQIHDLHPPIAQSGLYWVVQYRKIPVDIQRWKDRVLQMRRRHHRSAALACAGLWPRQQDEFQVAGRRDGPSPTTIPASTSGSALRQYVRWKQDDSIPSIDFSWKSILSRLPSAFAIIGEK
jgi:hypothetical protein